MNQGLAGGPRQESSYNVSVGDVRELVALSEEAPDVPTEGFFGLLSVVLEVPWIPRALVCALEVPHKDFIQSWAVGALTMLVPNRPRIVGDCE